MTNPSLILAFALAFAAIPAYRFVVMPVEHRPSFKEFGVLLRQRWLGALLLYLGTATIGLILTSLVGGL